MNRPVDPLCRWIGAEMRYESWEELAEALERERNAKEIKPWKQRWVDRMMEIVSRRKDWAA